MKVHWLKKILICFSVKEDALWKLPISTCSPTLLIIIFKRFWHCLMNNKSDIRFIDSHPKSNCSYNDCYLVRHPFLLYLFLVFLFNVCMIESGSVSSSVQLLTHLLTWFLWKTVYDPTFAFIFVYDLLNILKNTFWFLSYLVI